MNDSVTLTRLPKPNPGHTIEQMGEDLQRRLRRLGVVKGPRQLKPARQPPAAQEAETRPIDALLPGIRRVQTDVGSCYVLDTVFPVTHQHGLQRLADFHVAPLATAAAIADHPQLADLTADEFLFLDTETTGLAGAGTLAFMVGVAFFEEDAFVVRQYFLRDHGDETAMLHLLAELLIQRPGLVTFNGRSFDLPLLESRFILNRLDGLVGDLRASPHLDLLPPARRLWRARLGSCALGTLETNLLALQRTHEDVPGWAIPGLYRDYLLSGDAAELLRVFYHNRVDMLSMVTLAVRVLEQFAHPSPDHHPLDLHSLARWQIGLGRWEEAEATLQLAVAQAGADERPMVLSELGGLLKRQDRRDEALPLWRELAENDDRDVSAHVELAMYYEWHQPNLEVAAAWTRRALTIVDGWSRPRAALIRPELAHRLERLERKLAADGAPGAGRSEG